MDGTATSGGGRNLTKTKKPPPVIGSLNPFSVGIVFIRQKLV